MARPGAPRRAAAKRCAYHTEQKSLERTFENINPSIIAEVLASHSVRFPKHNTTRLTRHLHTHRFVVCPRSIHCDALELDLPRAIGVGFLFSPPS